MIGRTFSHYRIHEQLDSGGMGDVYRAEDLRLGRPVALKFLSVELTRNPTARARFEREARAVSMLEHPNVCTVHDVGETEDGRAFLAMPFYRGETLKERVKRGPLDLVEALGIVEQIAAGLAKAHQKSIIHRDIKPGNIFLTDDGQVKILDFGLAKEVGDVTVTQTGITFGSPAYVSPEQVLSQELDPRTDQWSLAVVAYEMLSGRRPFHAHSRLAILYNIVHREPEPITAHCRELPRAMDAVLGRALSKESAARYEGVEEFVAAMRRAGDEGTDVGHSLRLRVLAAVVLTLLALLIGWMVRRTTDPGLPPVIRIARTQPLTRAPGMERHPSFAPEGDRIAYVSDAPGVAQILLHDLGSRREVGSRDETLFDSGILTWEDQPIFSPDGEWIAFASLRRGGGVYLIESRGGEPWRVADFRFTPTAGVLLQVPALAFSPDNRWLVIAGSLERPGLFRLSLEELRAAPRSGLIELEPLPLPGGGAPLAFTEPAFSPAGDRLAYVELSGTGVTVSKIWTLAIDGSDPRPVTEGRYLDHQPVYAPDGRRLFFLSDRGGSHDVWTLPLDRRGRPAEAPTALTTGIGIGSFALSPNDHRLVYSKVEDRSNLHRVSIDAVAAQLEEAVPVTTGNHLIEYVDVSSDGRFLVFDSNREGNMDLYLMSRESGEARRLTSNEAHDWCPRFSPDGVEIVFHSLRSGQRDLWIWSLERGMARRLTDHPARDWLPDFSPDSREVVFESTRSGNVDLWIVPRSGGAARQLTSGPTWERFPVYSPDGLWVAYEGGVEGGEALYRIAAEGGSPERLTGVWRRIVPFVWSPDGRFIYALGRRMTEYQPNLWRISVADGRTEALTAFRELGRQAFQSLASDGEFLYFPLRERTGDLWLAELE